jgi:hypothetical protein
MRTVKMGSSVDIGAGRACRQPLRETPRSARKITRHIATARNVMRETGLSTEAWFLLCRRLGAVSAYTAPWTVTLTPPLMVDSEPMDYYCLENEKDSIHLVGK